MLHKLAAEAKLRAYFQYLPANTREHKYGFGEALRLQYPDSKEFKITAIDTSHAVQLNRYHQTSNVVGIQAVSRINCAFDFDKTPFYYGNAGELAIEALNVKGCEYWNKPVFGKYKRSEFGLLFDILRSFPQELLVIATVYELGADKKFHPVPDFTECNVTQQVITKYSAGRPPADWTPAKQFYY